MKIKHWAGYGTVDAKFLCDYLVDNDLRKCVIEVTGDHEWGLVREDVHDVFEWLLNGGKRFAKACERETSIEDLTVFDVYDEERKMDVAVYEILYWTPLRERS